MTQKKLKKDFDKEKMYQKIMPSIADTNEPEPLSREPVEPVVAAESAASPPDPAREAAMEAAAAAVRESAKAKPPGQQQYILRNFVEDMVIEKLGHTLRMLKSCECEKCKKDIIALALNELPTAYRVVDASQEQEAVLAIRLKYEVKVTAALIKAVQIVKTNPLH